MIHIRAVKSEIPRMERHCPFCKLRLMTDDDRVEVTGNKITGVQFWHQCSLHPKGRALLTTKKARNAFDVFIHGEDE